MKRLWFSGIAVAFSIAMISPALAQSGSRSLGSYQSILPNAGNSSGNAAAQVSTGRAFRQDQDVVGDPNAPPPAVEPTASINPSTGNGWADSGSSANAAADLSGASCGTGDCDGSGANTVIGLFGLWFDRDRGGSVRLSSNAGGGGLFSSSANENDILGFGVDLTRRNASGRGYGFRYWGLDSGGNTASLTGAPLTTSLTGLADLSLGGFDVAQIYNNGGVHSVRRDSSIYNIELNMLRNVGSFTTFRGREANLEIFGGFRWLKFDDDFVYSSVQDAAAPPGTPVETFLSSSIANSLLGIQMGGRSEVCLSNRWRLAGGTKVGIFNNYAQSTLNVRDNTGAFATITGPGTAFNFANETNELAMLGEFDITLIFQASQNSRFSLGYRVLGVAGVALSEGQMPSDFTQTADINQVNTNGDLLLQGGYFGYEYSF